MSLNKHIREEHTEESANIVSSNVKTAGNGSETVVEKMYQDNVTSQQINFKTDLNNKQQHCLNEYIDSSNKCSQSSIIKESSAD